MSIHLNTTEAVFRNELIFTPDAKAVNLDNTLTNLFMQIRYDGQRIKNRVAKEHTLDTLLGYMKNLEKDGDIKGVTGNDAAAVDWLRCNLATLVSRGNLFKEKVAALRPVHLESYRIRNQKHTRDYLTADQVYIMLRQCPEILARLKQYLTKGYDSATKYIANNQQLDIDTVAILHLVKNIQVDVRSTTQNKIISPFLVDQAKLFCDDVLRILTYQDAIPRSVMIEYLRTLIGFHLAIYTHKLIYLLPKIVAEGTRNVPDDWSLVVDTTGRLDSHIAPIACADMSKTFNGLYDYVRATFAVNAVKARITDPNVSNDIDYILDKLKNRPSDSEVYYELKINEVFGRFTAEEQEDALELRKYLKYEPNNFAKYVSILVSVKGPYQYKFYQKFLDNVSMKNSDCGFMSGGRSSKHERRGILGARLIELLVQLLVLEPRSSGGFDSQALSVSELMHKIRQRYGIIIDGTQDAHFKLADVQTQLAFRENVDAFKDKLRQIGFYTDLSDAGTLQKIRPRYKV